MGYASVSCDTNYYSKNNGKQNILRSLQKHATHNLTETREKLTLTAAFPKNALRLVNHAMNCRLPLLYDINLKKKKNRCEFYTRGVALYRNTEIRRLKENRESDDLL